MAAAAEANTTAAFRDAFDEKVLRSTVALARRTEPSEIAVVVASMLSSNTSCITGATVDVSGGWI